MRILFDQGVDGMRNKGNIALLQVAVNRLGKLWPSATLEVITSSPHLLRLYCPTALPVSPDRKYVWGRDRSLIDRAYGSIPRPALRFLLEAREEVWHRWPGLGSALKRVRPGYAPRPGQEPQEQVANPAQTEKNAEKNMPGDAVATVEGADLFVATGAQYMSDACKDDASRVLDRLQAANELGITTAMVGQGLGPIEDLELRQRAKTVLPLVNLIFIRDRETAPPLLDSLGVDPSHVTFTGDDAIELAYEARRETFGSAIGVSLRVASYTQVDSKDLYPVGLALQKAVTKHQARLIAIPISHSLNELDDQVLSRVLSNQVKLSTNHWRFETPLEIIKQVASCRLVVTGAFHTAVFALAQGIPAIGLAKSVMYIDKFKSLVDQFGSGCQVICLDAQELPERLTSAINVAWESAEQVRPGLLEAAARQIELGQAAYRRLFDLVESRRRNSAVDRTAREYA